MLNVLEPMLRWLELLMWRLVRIGLKSYSNKKLVTQNMWNEDGGGQILPVVDVGMSLDIPFIPTFEFYAGKQYICRPPASTPNAKVNS